MPISEELKRIYASNPDGERYIETLQFSHVAFSRNYFLTNDNVQWEFLLEDLSNQVFQCIPFQLRLPVKDDSGRQDLQIAITNIGQELIEELNAASLAPRRPIECTYRVYLNRPLTEPQNNPPLKLTILQVDLTIETLTAVATRADVLNRPFPRNVYRPDSFPGLDR
jgi:hypothetical protein